MSAKSPHDPRDATDSRNGYIYQGMVSISFVVDSITGIITHNFLRNCTHISEENHEDICIKTSTGQLIPIQVKYITSKTRDTGIKDSGIYKVVFANFDKVESLQIENICYYFYSKYDEHIHHSLSNAFGSDCANLGKYFVSQKYNCIRKDSDPQINIRINYIEDTAMLDANMNTIRDYLNSNPRNTKLQELSACFMKFSDPNFCNSYFGKYIFYEGKSYDALLDEILAKLHTYYGNNNIKCLAIYFTIEQIFHSHSFDKRNKEFIEINYFNEAITRLTGSNTTEQQYIDHIFERFNNLSIMSFLALSEQYLILLRGYGTNAQFGKYFMNGFDLINFYHATYHIWENDQNIDRNILTRLFITANTN